MGKEIKPLTNSKKPELVNFADRKERKLPYSTPEEKQIYQLREELKQLKRGLRASDNDWQDMVGAELNEFKYREFKANLVAHKKLVQMVAGVLAGAKDGLTAEECKYLAYEIEPEAFMYVGNAAAQRLEADIKRLMKPDKDLFDAEET